MPNELRGDMNGQGLRVGIAVARFNEIITKQLLDGALETLNRCGVRDSDITVAWVPGSFELPVVARAFAKSGRCDAVICLGAVIRGETSSLRYGRRARPGRHWFRRHGNRNPHHFRRPHHRKYGAGPEPGRRQIWQHGIQRCPRRHRNGLGSCGGEHWRRRSPSPKVGDQEEGDLWLKSA